MILDAGKLSLFGFDLRRGMQGFRDGWAEAFDWPILGWMSPQVVVKALFPDGGDRVLDGATSRGASTSAKAESIAIVLSDEAVLTRRVILPDLIRGELRTALELEVASLSPFPASDTVWGARFDRVDAGRRPITLAIASRAHVAGMLERHSASGGESGVEVWAWHDGPIVLDGYAEARRLKSQSRQRGWIIAALGAAILMVLVLALVPFLAMRQQVLDAQAQLATLQSESGDLLHARDTVVSGRMRLQAIRARIHERVDPLPMLDAVSQLLPDDVFLTRMEVRGGRVTLAGLASNAAALMESISSAPQIVGVRAPAPIAKAAGQKESFTIEFAYVPQGGNDG